MTFEKGLQNSRFFFHVLLLKNVSHGTGHAEEDRGIQ